MKKLLLWLLLLLVLLCSIYCILKYEFKSDYNNDISLDSDVVPDISEPEESVPSSLTPVSESKLTSFDLSQAFFEINEK